MDKKFYVASCVFTEEYPALSKKICDYVRERFNLPIIRCCVDKYKVAEFEARMPEDYRDEWRAIEHFRKFPAGSTMISICHNCSAIFEERHPEILRESFWELILSDEKFSYPNHGGEKISVQDCWRSKENFAEQEAVRELLRRMNFEVVELPENHERTNFCGYSLYQPQPPRNPALAPKRFLHGAQGLFQPHTDAQKKSLMEEHCAQIPTEKVAAYCHYCVRGLKLGGQRDVASNGRALTADNFNVETAPERDKNLGSLKAFHLAELLFEESGQN